MNLTMPKVSVIIPVYNVENYLGQCMDSIISQTYKNLEIIVVDDGSTDMSKEICDEYARIDSRIKVIHKLNGGLSDARNVGLDICTGDYISFVDSDDYLAPIFMEIFMTVMLSGNCEIVAMKGGTAFWDGNDYPDLAVSTDDCMIEYMGANDVLKRMLYQQIATGAPFKVYRRELFKNVKFPYGYLYEDVATTYKLFLKANKSAIIYGHLYAYRKRTDSIIRKSFNEKKLIALKIFDQLISDPDLLDRKLDKAASSRVYAMLYSVFLQIPEDKWELKSKVWKKLNLVRKTVMFDFNKLMRKKNRYAAWISLLGMNAAYKIGRKYGQKGSVN